jgi:hypothetical protein
VSIWKTIRDKSLLLPLAAIVLLTNLLVSPVGDFPLNDDWVYAKSVQDILETGRYTGHPYSDALFVLQAYWGALFCAIFGFSFTVLRISTLITLLVAAWGASLSASAAGIDRNKSLLLGAVFLANPIVLNLGYTFMTDIPFLALAHLALFFFIRAYMTPTITLILAGSALAAIAYFVRQFGLLLPIAYAASLTILLIRGRYSFNPRHLATLLAPWLIVALVLLALPDSARGTASHFDWNSIGNSILARAINALKHWTVSLIYLSLFLAPLFILLLSRSSTASILSSKKTVFAFSAAWLFLASLVITPNLHRLPFTGNMIYDFGVGPILLRGIVDNRVHHAPFKLGTLWWIPTLLGLTAALWLSWKMIRITSSTLKKSFPESESNTPDPRFFLFMLTAAYIGVLFIPGLEVLYDRYFIAALIPVGIFILLTITKATNPTRLKIAWSLCAFMYIASVVCLQDYMAWNRARWAAVELLEEKYAATPEDIDGGYEFNGWLTSDRFLKDKASSASRNYGPKGGWIVRDTYAVSFRPRENFNVIHEVPYFSWLGFEQRKILILQRFAEEKRY